MVLNITTYPVYGIRHCFSVGVKQMGAPCNRCQVAVHYSLAGIPET